MSQAWPLTLACVAIATTFLSPLAMALYGLGPLCSVSAVPCPVGVPFKEAQQRRNPSSGLTADLQRKSFSGDSVGQEVGPSFS